MEGARRTGLDACPTRRGQRPQLAPTCSCRAAQIARAALSPCAPMRMLCSQAGSSLQFESKAPECFGEASLHFEDELRVRQASVWSDGATVASWQVAHIEALIGFDLLPEAHRVLRRKLLGLVSCGEESITSGLERSEVDLLVEAVEECAYQKGQVVAAAASVDEAVYIVKLGNANVLSKKGEVVAQLRAGDFFGVRCLVTQAEPQKRTHSVSACGELQCLMLPAASLKSHAFLKAWLRKLSAEAAAGAKMDSVIAQRIEEFAASSSKPGTSKSASRPQEEVESSTASAPVGKGWKSGKLRNAIRSGALASAAALPVAPVAPSEGEGSTVEELEAHPDGDVIPAADTGSKPAQPSRSPSPGRFAKLIKARGQT